MCWLLSCLATEYRGDGSVSDEILERSRTPLDVFTGYKSFAAARGLEGVSLTRESQLDVNASGDSGGVSVRSVGGGVALTASLAGLIVPGASGSHDPSSISYRQGPCFGHRTICCCFQSKM